MSTQSILRTRITAPRPALIAKASSPTSIMKRPSPLPLPPTSNLIPFPTSLTVHLSPVMLSPHVHFPPTPSLVSTHSTHAPNSPDRAPTPVSPNSLEISPRGARAYSSFAGSFASSKRVPVDVPVTSSFSDDSNTVTSTSPSKSKPRAVRFGNLLSQAPLPRANSQEDLDKYLSSLTYPVSPYPRSPFPSVPSSPVSPAEDKENHAETKEIRKGVHSASLGPNGRVSKKSKIMGLTPAPARVSRGQMKASGQNTLHVPSPHQFGAPRVSSPLLQSETFASPVVESPQAVSSTKPMPLDLGSDSGYGGEGPSSRLSNAFWKSVSLNGVHEQEDVVMSSTYPLSAVEEGDSTPISAVPPFVFGRKDGTLWSPGLPRKQAPVEAVADSFLSPTRKVSFEKPTKSTITSPSPHDPFSAFPSFSSALTLGGEGSIAYPPSVIVQPEADRAADQEAVL